MTLIELYEKRNSLGTQARTFHDTHSGEWTEERQAEWDRMMADIRKLSDEIGRTESLNALDDENRRAAEPEKREVPPVNPAGDNPEGGNGEPLIVRAQAMPEYRTGWREWVRSGRHEALRSMNITTDPSGGYLVPDEFHNQVVTKLTSYLSFRQYCTVLQTSTDRDIPIDDQSGSAYWTGEEKEYTESDETVSQRRLGGHKLTALQKVSEELLQDSVFDIETFLSRGFARRYAATEQAAFTTGDGVGQPTGFIVDADVGVTTDSATAFTADEIIDLYVSLGALYRERAIWILNDTTLGEVAKLKDSAGQYIWQLGLIPGQPDTILGRPYKTNSSMATIEAEAKVIAFGDFEFYWIADRGTPITQRLVEKYSDYGQVGFRMARRVDGKLTVDEAIKVMQMAASGS